MYRHVSLINFTSLSIVCRRIILSSNHYLAWISFIPRTAMALFELWPAVVTGGPIVDNTGGSGPDYMSSVHNGRPGQMVWYCGISKSARYAWLCVSFWKASKRLKCPSVGPENIWDMKLVIIAPSLVWSWQAANHYLSQCWLEVMSPYGVTKSLHWRHNDRNGVSNHQLLNCLLKRLFISTNTLSKLHVTSLCEGYKWSPITKASNAENVSIWWRNHATIVSWYPLLQDIWHHQTFKTTKYIALPDSTFGKDGLYVETRPILCVVNSI